MRRAALRSWAAFALGASVAASGCAREPREPTLAADSTRTTRQRIAALEAGRNLGAGELQRRLDHPDPRVRRAAAIALGRIQDPRALPWLAARLDDPDREVGAAAAFALGQLQGLSETERYALQTALVPFVELRTDRGVIPYLEALAKQGGAEVVPIIATGLATGMVASGEDARPPEVEGAAAWGLSRIGTSLALEILAEAGSLRERAPRAACWIASAMAGDPTVAAGGTRPTASPDTLFGRQLRTLLDHPDATARAAGARALGKRGDPAAVSVLLPHLADSDWRVRASVLVAVFDLAPALSDKVQAREFCAALLADRHPLVREAAADALDRLGVGSHLRLVLPALADSVPAVRAAALRCVARSGGAEMRSAWSLARRDPVPFVRAATFETAVSVWGDAAGTDTLIVALQSPSVPERTAAADALSRTAARQRRRAAAALAAALRDADFAVAATAAEALGTLEAHEQSGALATAYAARTQGRPDGDVRTAIATAAAALAASPAGRSDTRLRGLVEAARTDPDPRVVRQAAIADARLRGATEPGAPPLAALDVALVADSLPAIDLGRPRVRIETRGGAATIELDGDAYPRTAGNFLRLVDQGFYDSGVFHRVVPSFVVQGGCPRGDGWGDAGYAIPCEYGDLRYEVAGTVGMAHAGKDTGGSQFFVTHVPVPRLDGRYTAFGRVVAGMDVIDGVVRGDSFRIVRDHAAATP